MRKNKNFAAPQILFAGILIALSMVTAKGTYAWTKEIDRAQLLKGFLAPPDSARPGVYWYFMDGNISRTGMTEDLEAMKKAGIGSVIFLEVNVGIPRGPVTFLSEEWQELFKHAVKEAERLGITLVLGSGPGWAGSGGPWVEPAQSMRHLVSVDTLVRGPIRFKDHLSTPQPKKPFFGYATLTDSLRKKWENYYQDVTVLAFRTPAKNILIPDIEEKALYYRAPFSSAKGVKSFLPTPLIYPTTTPGTFVLKDSILDISKNLRADGTLDWQVPPGNWTIRRLGLRNNGAVTRPAPQPGLGFECDKMDTVAFNQHFQAFMGKLLLKTGAKNSKSPGGWKMIHIDSWEMGAQNWSDHFRPEFQKRRGYDLLPYLPTYAGTIVGSREISERFLWDLRKTAQELVAENHAEHFKTLGRRSGLRLSIEPYDMNPAADLELGAVADVPMCEFWSKNFGFNTSFSCLEATSIAHVLGKPVVQAEAFTAGNSEGWKLYPGAIKDQGDWAFATGINKFYYHTFAHQPLNDQLKPGMTMGPYGVHWDRNQTWWPMANAYHTYIARCSYLLQQGKTVADILYLTPEGAPHVFRPPLSSTIGNDTIPDRRGYNFDGCSPGMLLKATVKDHKICFPDGGSYRLMILPVIETMTPELLKKIESLVLEGAYILGIPPKKSPSLVNFPACDKEVSSLAMKMWKNYEAPIGQQSISYGSGLIFHGGDFAASDSTRPYPSYESTAALLRELKVKEDFSSDGPVRYTHRTLNGLDIYFVANRSSKMVEANCSFRAEKGTPELWDPLTGRTRPLTSYFRKEGITTVPMQFDVHQSYFVVFDQNKQANQEANSGNKNFPGRSVLLSIDGPWKLSFDPKWGGPSQVEFENLTDWTVRPEKGIKYYSGTAVYQKTFTVSKDMLAASGSFLIDLGEVNCLAQVSLNGVEAGTLWTAPWSLDITKALKEGTNELKIKVVNLWPNRLIGDEQFASDGISNREWPEWMRENKTRNSQRITFASYSFYKKDSPLLKSGLLGPVRIIKISNK
ncbi:MAG: glycosyl hydrolase [Prolixibacteraceae bacterium]